MTQQQPPTDALQSQQPLSESQVQQYRRYVEERGTPNWTWETIPVGPESERIWVREFNQDTIGWYTDSVEDYRSWYDSESPFGGPVVPPMLPIWFAARHHDELGWKGGVMMITHHETKIHAPILAGTRLRYRARLVKKFIKRGRPYYGAEIEITDAETGQLVLEDYRELALSYRKVVEDGETQQVG